MATLVSDSSVILRGEAFARRRGQNEGKFSFGNQSELKIAVDRETKRLPDYTALGGGTRNRLDRVTALNFTMKVWDWNTRNLEIALAGNSTAIASGAVADEAHAAYKGGLVDFDYVPNTALSVTVTNVGGTTTYVEGTDYIINSAGIVVLEGGTIPDSVGGADNIEVSYTKLALDVIQALTNTGYEYEMTIVTQNEAGTTDPRPTLIHRMKITGATELPASSEEYVSLDLTGEILADPAISSSDLSKFYVLGARGI